MIRVSRKTNKVLTSMLLIVLLGAVYLFQDFGEPMDMYLKEDVQKVRRSSANVSSFIKCERNVEAAKSPGFSMLSVDFQNFLYYRHCRSFPIILDVPDKCGGVDEPEDVFLLLVIKSSPINYDRREVLRKTWAKERLHKGAQIRRIFISGTSSDHWEKDRLNKLLQLEHQQYNDILQWDFNDSFFNLTLKQALFFEWMANNCPHARFLLNGDDDVFANTNGMVEYLQGLQNNTGNKHLFTGHLITNAQPIRWQQSKYFVPPQVHKPNMYPPYCGGGGFLLSGHTALIINKMSQSIPLIPIDDVYIGMCLDKAKLAPQSHMGVKTLGWGFPSRNIDVYHPCYMRELLLIHKFNPGRIYIMWLQVNDPNLKCGVSRPTGENETAGFI
ncbi:N-acetyllactosaminide beta-1,3-N-acetylglucosaminyltransferase 3-like [Mugil cephalus]|uniref:N-acetyllactosaminide beta-1,3-N-acetylglucosaminyltransferase 3-like n=1 Tax=Mugil cephalus TaxID=48193 RepID=UPI001FB629D2|nr:N-acetyllactosaminide beta-1,3-N-acetylglucosaminyltransferase 3-like [Mugil cephalus]